MKDEVENELLIILDDMMEGVNHRIKTYYPEIEDREYVAVPKDRYEAFKETSAKTDKEKELLEAARDIYHWLMTQPARYELFSQVKRLREILLKY